MIKDALVPDESKKALMYCQRSYSNEVTIPNTVEKIQYETFRGCRHIQSLFVPDFVISIGDFCFSGCFSLETIRLPFAIEADAFCSCEKLKKIISKEPFPKNIRRRMRRDHPDLVFEIEKGNCDFE